MIGRLQITRPNKTAYITPAGVPSAPQNSELLLFLAVGFSPLSTFGYLDNVPTFLIAIMIIHLHSVSVRMLTCFALLYCATLIVASDSISAIKIMAILFSIHISLETNYRPPYFHSTYLLALVVLLAAEKYAIAAGFSNPFTHDPSGSLWIFREKSYAAQFCCLVYFLCAARSASAAVHCLALTSFLLLGSGLGYLLFTIIFLSSLFSSFKLSRGFPVLGALLLVVIYTMIATDSALANAILRKIQVTDALRLYINANAISTASPFPSGSIALYELIMENPLELFYLYPDFIYRWPNITGQSPFFLTLTYAGWTVTALWGWLLLRLKKASPSGRIENTALSLLLIFFFLQGFAISPYTMTLISVLCSHASGPKISE